MNSKKPRFIGARYFYEKCTELLSSHVPVYGITRPDPQVPTYNLLRI